MLVIITRRYDSTVLKKKVEKTLFDNDGKPIDPLTVSEERGRILIAAGVAREYIPATDDSREEETTVQSVDESSEDSNVNDEDAVATDESSAAAEDTADNAEETPEEEQVPEETDTKEESTDADAETKSKKETKKNKESK